VKNQYVIGFLQGFGWQLCIIVGIILMLLS
jgi:hypothetical protein